MPQKRSENSRDSDADFYQFVVYLRLAGWGFSARVGFSSGRGVFQLRWGFLGITGGFSSAHPETEPEITRKKKKCKSN